MDDPARWLPPQGRIFGWLDDDTTEHIPAPQPQPEPEPVLEWPVVEYLEIDPLVMIEQWADDLADLPIMAEMLRERDEPVEEVA